MDVTDALMYVLEGGCPHCDADLEVTHVGGIRSWLDDHYRTDASTVVILSPIAAAAMNVLDCDDENLDAYVDQFRKMLYDACDPDCELPEAPKIPEYTAPDGAEIAIWQDREDPISGEVGVIMLKCPDCDQTYEAYAITSGEYVLAGHPEFDSL